MDARSIGLVRPLTQVKPSQFVLFQYGQGLEPGIVVAFSNNARGVMHLRSNMEGRVVPEIYDEANFINESVVHIENARIVPDFDPSNCGVGRYNGGTVSLALYINADAVYLAAKYKYNIAVVNLFNGQHTNMPHSDLFYTKSWKIEAPNGEIDFQDYMAFSADGLARLGR